MVVGGDVCGEDEILFFVCLFICFLIFSQDLISLHREAIYLRRHENPTKCILARVGCYRIAFVSIEVLV